MIAAGSRLPGPGSAVDTPASSFVAHLERLVVHSAFPALRPASPFSVRAWTRNAEDRRLPGSARGRVRWLAPSRVSAFHGSRARAESTATKWPIHRPKSTCSGTYRAPRITKWRWASAAANAPAGLSSETFALVVNALPRGSEIKSQNRRMGADGCQGSPPATPQYRDPLAPWRHFTNPPCFRKRRFLVLPYARQCPWVALGGRVGGSVVGAEPADAALGFFGGAGFVELDEAERQFPFGFGPVGWLVWQRMGRPGPPTGDEGVDLGGRGIVHHNAFFRSPGTRLVPPPAWSPRPVRSTPSAMRRRRLVSVPPTLL